MEKNCDDKNEPVAFTINFNDNNSSCEKNKKFERFVQRSSLRQKNKSKDDNCDIKLNHSTERISEKRKLTRTYSVSNKENMRSTEEKDRRDYTINDDDDNLSQAGTYIMEDEQDDLQMVRRDILYCTLRLRTQ